MGGGGGGGVVCMGVKGMCGGWSCVWGWSVCGGVKGHTGERQGL